jgi:Tfp pilus assembly major pilin PilA
MMSSAGVPHGVKGWSWGAFFLNWIWAIGNKTWIGLLCILPIIGFVMAFVLGYKGREWAWKNARWDSLEHFNRVQRLWSIWALILTLGSFGIGVLAAIALPAYQDYTARAISSEVLHSMSSIKVALTERIQTDPFGGLLTTKEIQELKNLASSNKHVSGVDFYALKSYADIISTVNVNSNGGHIYLYTRDAGKSWVCGSTDYPVKYLPTLCRDAGGVDRPVSPSVEEKPKFGL